MEIILFNTIVIIIIFKLTCLFLCTCHRVFPRRKLSIFFIFCFLTSAKSQIFCSNVRQALFLPQKLSVAGAIPAAQCVCVCVSASMAISTRASVRAMWAQLCSGYPRPAPNLHTYSCVQSRRRLSLPTAPTKTINKVCYAFPSQLTIACSRLCSDTHTHTQTHTGTHREAHAHLVVSKWKINWKIEKAIHRIRNVHWIEGCWRCLSAGSAVLVVYRSYARCDGTKVDAAPAPFAAANASRQLPSRNELAAANRQKRRNAAVTKPSRCSMFDAAVANGWFVDGLWPCDKIKLESFKFENVLPFIIMTRPLYALH